MFLNISSFFSFSIQVPLSAANLLQYLIASPALVSSVVCVATPRITAVGTDKPGQPWGLPGFSSLVNSSRIFSQSVSKIRCCIPLKLFESSSVWKGFKGLNSGIFPFFQSGLVWKYHVATALRIYVPAKRLLPSKWSQSAAWALNKIEKTFNATFAEIACLRGLEYVLFEILDWRL